MGLKLKALLEGYAWERKADGSLPTLRDAIAVHEANIAETEYKYAGRKVTIDKNGTEDQTKWKVKFTDSNKTVDYVDAVANITPRPKMNEPRWQDNDGDGKWYEPEDLKEYDEDEFDRSSQMYSGGKSSREYSGDSSELVEKIEDCVERLMQNLSTNSNVPTAEKTMILKELGKISDLIDTLQDEL